MFNPFYFMPGKFEVLTNLFQINIYLAWINDY